MSDNILALVNFGVQVSVKVLLLFLNNDSDNNYNNNSYNNDNNIIIVGPCTKRIKITQDKKVKTYVQKCKYEVTSKKYKATNSKKSKTMLCVMLKPQEI